MLKASSLSDAESVAQAKADLDITELGFVSGDTFDSVTQDFTLPTTGSEGTTISWEVVSGSAIALSGSSNEDAAVTRPDHTSGDSDVRLRVTYSKNGATASEEFDLTVLKKDQVPLTASLTGSISPITIPAGSNSTETLVFSGGSQSLIIGTDIEVRIKTRPNTAAEAHLSMGVNTGVLFPSTDIIPRDSGDYTIELSGIGNYTGILDRTLNLTVTALAINSITYTAINTETSTALTAAAAPTVDPAEAAATALFDIDTGFTTETGLSFDTGTGAISGTASAVIDKSYTVSITGGDGTKYEGSTQSTSIQVRVTLSDADAVARAKNDLEATGLGFAGSDTWDGITQDFTLPVSIGTDGVTISWEVVSGSGIVLSGNSNQDASVSRPDYTDGDSNVKLRATYSKNGATASEEFDLTVLKKDQVPLTASLTGSISPITIPAGSNSTETLVFSGGSQSLIIGTDIEVRIKTRPNTAAEAHLSLGVNTGVLFPKTDIIPRDSGDYIIELSGIGNYTGTLDRTLNLTVTALGINSITYTAINAETSTALTAAAAPTVDPAEAATGALFDIDTGFTAETGLSFNTGTGAISGTASAVIDKSYTVSITGGDGTKYEGSTQSTSIQVRVTLSDADAVAMAKNDLEATGLGFAGSDTWDGITQDFTLPVSIGTDGVTISWEVVSGSGIVLSGSSNKDASVSRPDYTDGDSNVKLRATYSKNGATASEEFDLTVLKKDQVPLTASLTGSISPITIPAGSNSTETLVFSGGSQSLIIGTDIEVRIKTRPNTAAEAHLSLGVNTGVLFPSTGIIPNDSGDYTIELSGIGNYTGTLDRTLNLTVTALGINSITYTAINAETSTALTAAAVPTVDPAEAAAGALFDIDTGFTTETGLSFDTGTGAISGTASAVIDKSYTVSITGGDGTKYEGSTQSTSIQVRVTLSDADAVAMAKNDLEATGLGFAGSDTWDGITQDFTLPVSIGTDGVTISWEVVSGSGIVLSGNSNKDASVSRPDYTDGDSNVKLRATYSKNGATASEEFDLTVLKKDQVPLTASLTGSISPITIPAGSNSTETLVFSGGSQSLIIGTDIEVRIKTRPNTAAEAHLSMGVRTGVLFPSTDIIPRDGGDYTIELSGIGNYTGTLDRTLNLTVTALGISSITYTAINAETSTALTAAAVPTVDPAEAAAGALFDIDAGFTTETGLSFNTGTGAISGTASAVIDKNYTVSITGGDGTKYEGSTQSTSIQVRVTLSDADAVARAKNDLEATGLGFAGSDTWDGITQDFTLPVSIGTDGVTISWEVVSGSGISLSGNSNQDASVSRPDYTDGDSNVKLRATYSKNGATASEEFDLTVLKKDQVPLTASLTGSISPITIPAGSNSTETLVFSGGSQSLIFGTDIEVRIKTRPNTAAEAHLSLGVNTGVLFPKTDIIPRDSGDYIIELSGIGNYTGTLDRTLNLTVTALGINSITYTAINAETSTALTAAAAPTVDPAEAAAGALFDIDTGFTTETGLSFDTGTGAISGTASAVIDKSYTVSITGGDATKYEGSTQSTSIQVKVTLSDADSVAAAKAALVITDITFASGEDKDSVTQDVTLPASGEEATTIAWSSDNTAIDATGTVTRPSASSSDATVTLTATISKGSASDTKTFVLTVLKEEPIDIGTLGSFTIDVDAATAKTNTESSHSATGKWRSHCGNRLHSYHNRSPYYHEWRRYHHT